jgi:hypothetical protein
MNYLNFKFKSKMIREELIKQITSLSTKFHEINEQSIEEFNDAEWLEKQVEDLIADYCVQNNYLVNGFPTEKKCLPIEELDEDYFCRERYQLYLDFLVIDKIDVADLMWHFINSFWPNQFESKSNYIETIKEQIESGVFYDLEI